ncbi:uncharacterized protein VTP21DRAFT_3500 [Calcarisporiella thermophila]|uniref:uncharacterized protein n=1 Tax=Calcarisporiella thermophila TaxID=911321 RepID=UPI0037434039
MSKSHNFSSSCEMLRNISVEGPPHNTVQPFQLKVLKLLRYTIDRDAKIILEKSLGITMDERNLYDVIVSDGIIKDKVILSPFLNRLIRHGILRIGCNIEVNSYQICEKLGPKNEDTLFMIVSLSADTSTFDLTSELQIIVELSKIPWISDIAEKLEYVPLLGERSYLDLWDENDFIREPRWEQNNLLVHTSFQINKDHPCIREILTENYNRSASSSIAVPAIGRVVTKSSIKNFGKPEDKNNAFPFQFYIEIADCSANIRVVIWNELVFKTFDSIHVGDVVYIENYRIKRIYGITNDMEFSLNSKSPAGRIRKLRENNFEYWPDIDQIHRFPLTPIFRLRLLPRILYDTTPDGFEFDVIGRVVYVSGIEREENDNGVGLSEYRWVKLYDTTCERGITLKLYRCSQGAIFKKIHPDIILICTRVKLCSIARNSKSPRYTFVITTSLSQFTYIDDLNQNDQLKERFYDLDPEARVLIPRHDEIPLKDFCYGGYFNLPISFQTFEEFESFDHKVKITPLRNLNRITDKLSIQERTRTFVIGSLKQVEFNDIFLAIMSEHDDFSSDIMTRENITSPEMIGFLPRLPFQHYYAPLTDSDKNLTIELTIQEGEKNLKVFVEGNADEQAGALNSQADLAFWKLKTFIDFFADYFKVTEITQYELDELQFYIIERLAKLESQRFVFFLDLWREINGDVQIFLSKIFSMSPSDRSEN